ncbi:capsular biosynthesis protein, partial [Enorma massiliensis]|nr:capsular biosynthesis protein [Enorma massiliensis]
MPRKKKASSDALVVQNAAKTLLANIRFASVDRPVKSIVLTSSVPNEGKS